MVTLPRSMLVADVLPTDVESAAHATASGQASPDRVLVAAAGDRAADLDRLPKLIPVADELPLTLMSRPQTAGCPDRHRWPCCR